MEKGGVMDNIERAEAFFTNLKQFGYEKNRVGRWDERIEASDTGFPTATYICPFCGHQEQEPTNYCAQCGARLK